MARFDIYRNESKKTKLIPYLIDVQSNVVSGLATRIVIPVRSLAGLGLVELPVDLFPTISILGENYFIDTPQLAAIPVSELKNKIGAFQEYQFQIQAALDRIFGAH